MKKDVESRKESRIEEKKKKVYTTPELVDLGKIASQTASNIEF